MTQTDEKLNDPIKLVAVGDILIGMERQESDGTFHEATRKDPNSAFTSVNHITGKADIAFFNLEAPLSDKGKLPKGRGQGWRCRPEMLTGIAAAGFNVANLANNHIMDFGAEALVDSFERLTKHNIAYIGAGRDMAEARKPVIMERKGTRIGFYGLSTNQGQGGSPFAAGVNKPGINFLKVSPLYAPPQINDESLEQMMEDISNLKSLVDINIFSFHTSFSKEVMGSHTLAMHQVGALHAAIDAGADLILAHGPHLLQGIEVYKGKVIFYNLGNFVVDRVEVATGYMKTLIATCEISDKQIQKVSFLPTIINNQGPQPLSPEDENWHQIRKLMEQLSRKQGTMLSFEGAEGVVNLQ